MTNKEMKKKLGDIFNRYENADIKLKEIIDRGWVFCENEKEKEKEKEADLLFVGINPSYPNGAKPECYGYPIEDTLKKKKDGGYRRHYAVFEKLAGGKPSEKKWAYMDLFYFRETDQNKIKPLMKTKEGIDFICDQLKLSYEIIQDISPKVIVVCNKGIHDFFGINRTADNYNIWMGFRFSDTKNKKEDVKIIEGIASDVLNNDNFKLKGTKIIFSKHLTYEPRSVKEKLKESIQYALQY